MRSDTAYLYIYRPRQALTAEPVRVYVEGRIMGTLQPGQYLEVPWFRFGKPMRLCLSSLPATNACQYVVPDMAQLSYLRINTSAAPHPWQWVLAADGAAALDELDQKP